MSTFLETQFNFIAHIKDPEHVSFDGDIEPRRLKIYQELFFNNILSFLQSGFPVLNSLYSDEDWQSLARQFFVQHDCRSPYFVDISKEFVEFLSNEYCPKESDPAFLLELAHYEWLELDVSIRKTKDSFGYWEDNHSIHEFAFSELASLVSYHYPVHQICDSFQPVSPLPEPIYIVVYRNIDDEVNFVCVNGVTAHLLVQIQQHGVMNLTDSIEAMCQALPQFPKDQIAQTTTDTLATLLSQQILVIPQD